MYNFFHVFFCYNEKNDLSFCIFCLKLTFLPQSAWFFFLKLKNGVLEIFPKSTYVLKFWKQWNSSLNRKTSLKRTCLNRKFTVVCLFWILEYVWVSSEQFLWHFFNSYLFPLRPYVMKNLIKNLRNRKNMNTSLIWISTHCESYCFIAAKEHWPTFRVIDSVYEEVYIMGWKSFGIRNYDFANKEVPSLKVSFSCHIRV